MCSKNTSFDDSSLAGSAEFLEQQFQLFQTDPSKLSKDWRDYFAQIETSSDQGAQSERYSSLPISADQSSERVYKQVQVTELINAFRLRGHEHANIDPLNLREVPEVREIDPSFYGFTEQDMQVVFDTASLQGPDKATLKEILDRLRKTYCGSIGTEFMHILDTSQKKWIQNKLESVNARPQFSFERRQWLLKQLTAAEGLERYLHNKYTGQKRFSLEGGESLIVMLNALTEQAGDNGVNEFVMGMAHRGRLNVLVNVFGKKPADLFSEFDGKSKMDLVAGDVKYHQGFSSDLSTKNGSMHLALAFNPSHLEIVSPVVKGSVRARQDRRGDAEGDQVLPIVIHGDAAFAGQGVVMETFNMSGIRGFSIHGSIHIVINNQIGFTTSNPRDARSTPYCTDVAKMTNIPIFHVNADDPESVYFVTQLAFEYRKTFKSDVVIDLVCYRRHGHNEADEPSATQPRMYKVIKKLLTTRQKYADLLVGLGIMPKEKPAELLQYYRTQLEHGEPIAPNILEDNAKINHKYMVDWKPFLAQDKKAVSTVVDKALLQRLAEKMIACPEGYSPHPRVAKIYNDRAMMAKGQKLADWGFAETLAYASLLHEGSPIRITGQDAKRGTFFHRHAALHEVSSGEVYIPLQHMAKGQPTFTIIDSLLSEEAVLGYEYGYATTDPNTLCIWEAQFGDFANGAQVVIDQFITSGEVKWGRFCGLTLFLPHGYEGQGPEHSSARPERFLQLCANENMDFVVPTTPSQIFHMIRRQVLRRMRRPLVVMTPKSLLRHPQAVNPLEDLANGRFEEIIDDGREDLKASKVKRIILCSGKIFYEINALMVQEQINDMALVRVEQIYPFPYQGLQDIVTKYKNAKDIVWCQEEPKNQGAWRAVKHRIERVKKSSQEVLYRGRHSSASPAVGQANVHAKQQAYLIDCALDRAKWKEPSRPGIK